MEERAQGEVVVYVLAVDNGSDRILVTVESNEFV